MVIHQSRLSSSSFYIISSTLTRFLPSSPFTSLASDRIILFFFASFSFHDVPCEPLPDVLPDRSSRFSFASCFEISSGGLYLTSTCVDAFQGLLRVDLCKLYFHRNTSTTIDSKFSIARWTLFNTAVKTRHSFEFPMTVCGYHSHNFAIFAVETDFNGKERQASIAWIGRQISWIKIRVTPRGGKLKYRGLVCDETRPQWPGNMRCRGNLRL